MEEGVGEKRGQRQARHRTGLGHLKGKSIKDVRDIQSNRNGLVSEIGKARKMQTITLDAAETNESISL